MDRNIVISTRTILITLLAIAGVWLIWQMQAVILILFVSLLIALALDPFVHFFCNRGISRSVSVIIIYLLLIALALTVGAAGISPMISQLDKLLTQLPSFFDALIKFFGFNGYFQNADQEIAKQITGLSGTVVSFTLSAFSSIIFIITIFVFVAYILLYFDNLKKQFAEFFPLRRQKKVKELIDTVEVNVGSWLRGELVLMFTVGVLTLIGLLILGVDYALPLALIAGFLEIVPNIGPIVSTIPAAVVAFSVSPITGIGVIALFILVQQLENNLIVPKVMQKAVGFNPLLTMLVIITGAKLFGLVGAVLAVPVTLVAITITNGIINMDSKA